MRGGGESGGGLPEGEGGFTNVETPGLRKTGPDWCVYECMCVCVCVSECEFVCVGKLQVRWPTKGRTSVQDGG